MLQRRRFGMLGDVCRTEAKKVQRSLAEILAMWKPRRKSHAFRQHSTLKTMMSILDKNALTTHSDMPAGHACNKSARMADHKIPPPMAFEMALKSVKRLFCCVNGGFGASGDERRDQTLRLDLAQVHAKLSDSPAPTERTWGEL